MSHVRSIAKPIVVQLRLFEILGFSAAFVALAVALPWLAHQFRLAGPTFLPMHIFVFVAALLLGWRPGFLVGLLTPFISYTASGLPIPQLLPQITIELAVYGLVAGFLREVLHLNFYLSLLGAMFAGRIALFLVVWALNASPVDSFVTVKNTVELGWPGILIQVITVPLIVFVLNKTFGKRST